MANMLVRQGGLFRCCIAHLGEELTGKHEDSYQIGDVLTCKFCKKPTLVLAADRVWESTAPVLPNKGSFA